MTDYIKREDAKEYLHRYAIEEFNKRDMKFAGRLTAMQVEKIPSADVEEVVRCKDCKHWMKMDGKCFPNADVNDFCSNGERKTNEID